MNARIVNLRSVRKRREREERRQEADVNAAEHGRSKAERTLTARRNEIEEDRLDGHRRTDDD